MPPIPGLNKLFTYSPAPRSRQFNGVFPLDDEAQDFETSPLQGSVLPTRKYPLLQVEVGLGNYLLRHPGNRADSHLTKCKAFCIARGFKMYLCGARCVSHLDRGYQRRFSREYEPCGLSLPPGEPLG